MQRHAIIVAGGSGSRMKTEVPKQFLELNGIPVLMHTIQAFYNSSIQVEVLLVLNRAFHSYWDELCKKYNFTIPHKIINGGEQRFDSVKNALDTITEKSLIAVHDAVRPVITDGLIVRCFETAEKTGCAIPVTTSRDSLRSREGDSTKAINRDSILIVQTPQVFQSEILKNAYLQPFSPDFTDDASVVEKAGYEVAIVEGDFKNIKITYAEDLLVASLFLKN